MTREQKRNIIINALWPYDELSSQDVSDIADKILNKLEE